MGQHIFTAPWPHLAGNLHSGISLIEAINTSMIHVDTLQNLGWFVFHLHGQWLPLIDPGKHKIDVYKIWVLVICEHL